MTNKGKNKGADDPRRSEDTTRKNAKDEAVHRDPDIAGVMRRESNDVHMRDRRDRG
jgi:hypothetical protein